MNLQRLTLLLWVALLPIAGIDARKPKHAEPEPPAAVEETDSVDLEENDEIRIWF